MDSQNDEMTIVSNLLKTTPQHLDHDFSKTFITNLSGLYLTYVDFDF
jgi:hypothetical protein